MTQVKAQVFTKALNQAYVDKNFKQVAEIMLDSAEVPDSEFKPYLGRWLYDTYSYGTNGNSVHGVPILLGCRSLVEKSLENLDMSETVFILKEWERKLDEISGKIDNILISSRYISEPPSTLIRVIFNLVESALYLRFPFQQDNIVRFYDAFRDALNIISGESHLADKKQQAPPEIPVNDGEKSIVADSLRYFSSLHKPRYIAICSHILNWLLGSAPRLENSSVVTFPYYREFEGKTGIIRLELYGEGTGEIYPHPVRSPFLRYDMDAENCLKNIKDFASGIPGLKEKFPNYNISHEILDKSPRYPLKNITDISFGAAFTAGVLNLFSEAPIDTDCCISAGIDDTGKLLPVSHIPEKIDAAIKAKMRKFVLCCENYENVKREFADPKIQLIPAARIEEVNQAATGLTEMVDNYLGHLEGNLRMMPRYYPEGYDIESLAVNLIMLQREGDSQGDAHRKTPLKFSWNDEIFYRNIILADPGYGKTWLLKHLGSRLLNGLKRDMKESGGSLYDIDLPVFLRLGDIASSLSDRNDFENALLVCIIDKYYSGGNEAEFGHFLREKLRNNTLFLLLDALDEVDSDKTALLRKHLDEFCRKYDRCPVVITSRNTGFQPFRREFRFEEMEIQKLDDEQIREFIGNWFGRSEKTKAVDKPDDSFIEAIYGELRNVTSVRNLSGIPLFLSFLCKFREEGSLKNIRRRRDVFEKALLGIMTFWRSEKTYDEMGWTEITFMLRVLERVAYKMFTGEKDQADEESLLQYIEEASEEIQESHKQEKTSGLRLPAKFKSWRKEDMLAENLLDEFIRTGILVKSGTAGKLGDAEQSGTLSKPDFHQSNNYLFIHRSFLEYLTTSHIARKPDWLEELKQHFEDSRWEEIITMMAGFYEGNGGDETKVATKSSSVNVLEMVNAIIAYSDKVADENHYLEILAGKCFIEWDEKFRQVPDVYEVFSRHINRMFETIHSIDYYKRSIGIRKIKNAYVDVLAGIRADSIVNYILENSLNLAPEYYQILGKMGTEIAMNALIKLLKYNLENKFICEQLKFYFFEIDWQDFIRNLKFPTTENYKYIFGLLDEDTKEIIRLWLPEEDLTSFQTNKLKHSVANLLKREDFYQKGLFSEINIPKIEQEMKSIGQGKSKEEQVLEFNCHLLISFIPRRTCLFMCDGDNHHLTASLFNYNNHKVYSVLVKSPSSEVIKYLMKVDLSMAQECWLHLLEETDLHYGFISSNRQNCGVFDFELMVENGIYQVIPFAISKYRTLQSNMKLKLAMAIVGWGIKEPGPFLIERLKAGDECNVYEQMDLHPLDSTFLIHLGTLVKIENEQIAPLLIDILEENVEENEYLNIRNRFGEQYFENLHYCNFFHEYSEYTKEEVKLFTLYQVKFEAKKSLLDILAEVCNEEYLDMINNERILHDLPDLNDLNLTHRKSLNEYIEETKQKIRLRIITKQNTEKFRRMFYNELKPLNEKYGVYESKDDYSTIKPIPKVFYSVRAILMGLSIREEELEDDEKNYKAEIKNALLKLLSSVTRLEIISEIQRIFRNLENETLELIEKHRQEIARYIASKLSLSSDHYPFLQDLIKLLRDENITVRNFARELYEFIR